MKRLLPLIAFVFISCSGAGGLVTMVNPVNFLSSGFYPLLIIGELETNLSSLVIDKTKAKVDVFVVNPYEVLPEHSKIFVMPVVVNANRQKTYSTYYSNMIENYLTLNGFAKPVKTPDDADYVLMITVEESPERTIGKNFSSLKVTIVEKNERPVFYANIITVSTSDRNFYYYPSKAARPVKELTLFGLEELFEQGLPKAFTATND